MKLLAIDGNSILNRAFYGVKLLTNKDGIYTNAIFGFLNIMLKLLKEHSPDAVAVAFDVSRKTFRNDKYEDYKANRKGMPDELRVQLPLIKEILTDLGYAVVGLEGYEGDDILGTLSHFACQNGHTAVVATGDRDCLQLVNDCVSVSLAKTKETVIYTPEKVKEDFGITPKQVIDLKALMGDSSDNIPGVKGIGEKTALGLIQKYNSIEEIYDNIDSIEATPRVKNLLSADKEMAFKSYDLATICLSVPIPLDIEAYKKRPTDEAALSEILKRLELFSFFDKLGVGLESGGDSEESKMKTVSPKEIDVVGGEASAIGFIGSGETAILLKEDGGALLNIGDKIIDVKKDDAEAVLTSLFKSNFKIQTYKAKPVYKLARRLGFENVSISFDAELSAYLLSPASKGYELSVLRAKYLDGLNFETDEKYLDILSLPYLCEKLREEQKSEGMDGLYNEIELPLCEVLSSMEDEGFAVDRKSIEEFGERLRNEIDLTKEQIYRLAGEEFNINSTKELGSILFEKLGLPAKKKTKTGYSTNADVLESLMDKHPIIPCIMEYRKLSKLESTYVAGLLKVISDDGRVHSTFNQTETRTGRISSTEPNVQNIPVRSELGSEIRKFFVARDGYTLVDADYSQIELRILAHIANDKNMIKAFNENLDIHAMTASQVFGYPIESLPSALRSRAKAINFGIVYGISAFSLSNDIGVSVREAKEYIEAYLRTYNGVASYMERVVKEARENGFVKTIYGRKRDLADINASNKLVRAFAERVALNTPIQGTAADIIKLAMIRVYNRLKNEELDARLILQVHDELIVEAPVLQAERVRAILKEEMENAAKLNVPLVADVHSGENWYIAKG